MQQSPFLGILSLDTDFPRILGDAGNTDSYPYPARQRIIKGAGPTDIVQDGVPSEHLAERFIQAAQELEGQGACALVSTCGFLITLQDRIAASVRIPVLVSALSLVPLIGRATAGPVGILTAHSAHLGQRALTSAGIEPGTAVIAGMQKCEAFRNAFLAPTGSFRGQLDTAQIQITAIAQAREICTKMPDVKAIVLECGNLPPYASEISKATGKRVYSILDAAKFITAQRLIT